MQKDYPYIFISFGVAAVFILLTWFELYEGMENAALKNAFSQNVSSIAWSLPRRTVTPRQPASGTRSGGRRTYSPKPGTGPPPLARRHPPISSFPSRRAALPLENIPVTSRVYKSQYLFRKEISGRRRQQTYDENKKNPWIYEEKWK